MLNVKHYKPKATVYFYTETQDLVARSADHSDDSFDNDIISIKTTRDMGSDCPTFTITLVARNQWLKYIGSNDLVKITMGGHTSPPATVFWGLVDDIRKNSTISSDGTPQRTVTITGRGMGKALIRFDVGIVPEADVTLSIGWLEDNGVNLSGATADGIATLMWDKIAKKFVNYKWGKDRQYFDIVKTNFSSRKEYKMSDSSSIVNYHGSLYSFYSEIADAPFNELFWEIDSKGKPTFILRPTPFSKSDWNKLPSVTVTDSEIVDDSIGRSDVETYTLFSTGMKMFFSSSDPNSTTGVLPLWYEPYAWKYGIHRMQVNTLYAAYASTDDVGGEGSLDSDAILRKSNELIYNWNIRNNQQYNGSIVVTGDTRFKVGTRLLLKSNEQRTYPGGMEFYIRGVSHDFTNFESWTTTLYITRGEDPSIRFSQPYGMSTDYAGIGFGVYDPAKAKELLTSGGQTAGGTGSDIPLITGDGLVKADRIVALAQESLKWGMHYLLGGGTFMPGGRIDCSFFTQTVYKRQAGVNLPRTAAEQYKATTRVPLNQLVPGDLVFFSGTYKPGISHVGIVVGGGKMINASGTNGDPTPKLESYNSGYWATKQPEGGRILATGGGGGSVPYNGVSDSYNKRTKSGVTASQINRVLGGRLAGMGASFISIGKSYNLDPAFLAAVAIHESGNGTSNAIKTKNNAVGYMDANNNFKTLKYFPSIQASLEASAYSINKYNADTLRGVGRIYCPVGADNDPTGLNQHWIPRVAGYVKKIVG